MIDAFRIMKVEQDEDTTLDGDLLARIEEWETYKHGDRNEDWEIRENTYGAVGSNYELEGNPEPAIGSTVAVKAKGPDKLGKAGSLQSESATRASRDLRGWLSGVQGERSSDAPRVRSSGRNFQKRSRNS